MRIGHPSAVTGKASIAWTGHRRERPRTPFQRNASGRRRGGNGIAGTALGRHPRARIRPPARPTALRRNAFGRHPRHRIRQPSWWERNRRHRPRALSQGPHPTVIASNRAGRNALERRRGERPRAPVRPAGNHAHPAWCRPTSACSLTPLRVDEIVPILTADLPSAASRSMIGGAAERRRWAGTSSRCAKKPAPDSAP